MRGPCLDGPGARGLTPSTSRAWDELTERLLLLSHRGMLLGLERVERVLERMGHPERGFAAVHIAGSNGKGSTAAFAAQCLVEAGLTVGLYTSPHLVSLKERIRVLRPSEPAWLSDDEWVDALSHVDRCSSRFEDLTFFEAVTCAAFFVFAKRRVDVAIVEAGLGARLDATRLCDARVSVLTELALEHTEILGNTIEAIAAEKAAVIRARRPIVFADSTPAAMAVIETRARDHDAKTVRIGRDIFVQHRADGLFDLDLGDRQLHAVRLSLAGPHQGRNAVLAAKAATLFLPSIRDQHVYVGLSSAKWPGRLETLVVAGCPVVLDGAHNPHGMEALVRALELEAGRSKTRPVHAVFGVLADKDARQMLSLLMPMVKSIVFSRAESARSRNPADLVAIVPNGEEASEMKDAIRRQIARARDDGGTVLVTGSLRVVGEARAMLAPLVEVATPYEVGP